VRADPTVVAEHLLVAMAWWFVADLTAPQFPSDDCNTERRTFHPRIDGYTTHSHVQSAECISHL